MEKRKKLKTIAACKECGEKRMIQGRGLCGKCYSRTIRKEREAVAENEEAIKSRAETIAAALPAPNPAPNPTPTPAPRTGLVIRVDFERMAHLLEKVRLRAEAELRDMPSQVLWELNEHFNRVREGQ